MAGNTKSLKNKAYLIEDGDNNDISFSNIHVTSPYEKMYIPVINATQIQITLKKRKPIGQVRELEKRTENINATKKLQFI